MRIILYLTLLGLSLVSHSTPLLLRTSSFRFRVASQLLFGSAEFPHLFAVLTSPSRELGFHLRLFNLLRFRKLLKEYVPASANTSGHSAMTETRSQLTSA
jgi:hypothetical protein